MKKNLILALSAFALFGMSGSAKASLVDVTLGNVSNSVTYSSGGSYTPNVDLQAPAPGSLSLGPNAIVIAPPSSVTGQYLQPTGPIFAGSYLAVLGGGSATFTLASNLNDFAFTWGTVDLFNTLKITDSLGHTFTFVGNDVLTRIGFPTPGSLAAQTDIKFLDPFASIVSAQFSSSTNSFEVANFSQSNAVPLPAALPLFAAGLAGLTGIGYRKKRKVRA